MEASGVAIVSLIGYVVSFTLGWMTKRRKTSAETDGIIIANAMLTMKMYKATYEDKVKHISDQYTELKIEVEKLREQNYELIAEIKKLREKI